ncbi:recombinase family protein [Ruegeria sp. 2205SS24-7]|uniref:recombinase family protein n=1 Tax=Ruegeria discodermiae TaxID=3064389 RepID=UPI002741B2F8|nr:recombinase family protein [Ruegeria sp. 2205SS24-7]MDP5220797.1 recombinase family protein [Ruegeria sp. 2205SS24-7]
MRRIRCAIYTRKSSEEGLEQDFNSLDAQREACEAYIASQKHEGWELLSDHYDDGGISGGHLDRPALQRLMQAVDEKRVDQIVVYKIDRLTRSLADFAKLVDRLDAADASFVSVTQSFNTSTSMGRLTLNVLLSFAQFEREVTAERIRDKIAASKRKGLWMGGNVPLGYQADGRTLKIVEEEAETIRTLFNLYLEHQSVLDVKEQAQALGLRSRRREHPGGRVTGGTFFDRGHIHHLLSNPIYAGRIRHKGQVYEGQHPAIIDPTVWSQVQHLLTDGAARERGVKQKAKRSELAGKLFDETGDRLTPSHSRKNGKRLRYYISGRLVTDRSQKHPDAWRLPAEQLENLLAEVVSQHLSRPNAMTSMVRDMSAAEIASATELLRDCQSIRKCLGLIARADLRQGSLAVQLDPRALARTMECRADQVDAKELAIEAPFRMRRRGVELKLHLGDAPPEIDQTLVRNIIKARQWLAMIIDGRTFSEIAESEGTSKRRVQDVVDLAMLAPYILDAIAAGEHPDGLTTDYLIKSSFPAIWADQHRQFAAL